MPGQISRRSLFVRWRRFRRDARGATFVEFALVAAPFIILLFGSIEIGFIYWGTKELEHATAFGSRLVRTGQAQGLSSAQLKTRICSETALLINCETKLRLDVQSALTFSAFAPVNPVDQTGNLKGDAAFSYQPGGRNAVVLIRTFYDWKMLMGGTYIMRAATPLKNEPF